MRFRLTRRQIGVAVLLLTGIYAVILLYPFRWQPPRLVENGFQRSAAVLSFPGPGMASTEQPPRWVTEAARLGHFHLSLEIMSLQERQHGPARIMTLSKDARTHDFSLGQDGTDLVIYLKREDGLQSYLFEVPDAIEAGRWQTVEVSIEGDRLLVQVDGAAALNRSFATPPLRSWNARFPLTLGNERTGNRPWLGEIRQARVRVGELEIDYLQPGELLSPSRFWSFETRPPNFRLLTETSRKDIAQNVLLFVPLGVLLGFWIARPGVRRTVAAIAVAAGVSLIFESLQLGFSGRYASLNDVVFNTIGAATGYLMAMLFRKAVRSAFASPMFRL